MLAGAPVEEERENLNLLKEEINSFHNAIFPHLVLDLDIALGIIDIDLSQQLVQNSKVDFLDTMDRVSWSQQGSGSQRALFWTLLQVRSMLNKLADLADQKKKTILEYEKQIKIHQEDAAKAKTEPTKGKKIRRSFGPSKEKSRSYR